MELRGLEPLTSWCDGCGNRAGRDGRSSDEHGGSVAPAHREWTRAICADAPRSRPIRARNGHSGGAPSAWPGLPLVAFGAKCRRCRRTRSPAGAKSPRHPGCDGLRGAERLQDVVEGDLTGAVIVQPSRAGCSSSSAASTNATRMSGHATSRRALSPGGRHRISAGGNPAAPTPSAMSSSSSATPLRSSSSSAHASQPGSKTKRVILPIGYWIRVIRDAGDFCVFDNVEPGGSAVLAGVVELRRRQTREGSRARFSGQRLHLG